MDLSRIPEFDDRLSHRLREKIIKNYEHESQTLIHCMWSPKGCEGSLVISDRLHLLCLSTGMKCRLLFTIDCTVNKRMHINEENDMYFFSLILEGLPKGCRYFDIIDDYKAGWWIHSVMANRVGIYWVELH